jgi:hypothetical protein
MVRGCSAESERARRMLPTAITKHQAETIRRDADDYQLFSERMDLADCYWVTRDMAASAMQASADVPSLSREDAPSMNGLMCFSSPLPPMSTVRAGGVAMRGPDGGTIESADPVPVDALAWMVGRFDIVVLPLVRTHRLAGPIHDAPMPLQIFETAQAKLPAVLADMTSDTRDEWGLAGAPEPDPDMAGLLAFLSACWVLMMTPTVAERKSLDGQWGGRATGQTRPGDLVTAVDLRPLRYIRAEHDSSGRRLTTRHIVRGHWTHQPHGRDRAERRLQWIAPYVRGPECAPLVQTEKVMVWRR